MEHFRKMSALTSARPQYRWIGRGIYTTAEASRLTAISARRIRRWVQGYRFGLEGGRRTSPPVLTPEVTQRDEGFVALTFRDLIEVMCVHGFLKAGVKWPLLRNAHQNAAEILGLDHPFATRQFLTDGHSVLLKTGEESLLDLVSNQYALVRILSPYLKTDGLDFVGAFAARWWPMGKREPVVLDAGRSFGQPIVPQGVPTVILYRAYLAESRAKSSPEAIGLWPAPARIDPSAHPLLVAAALDEKTVRYVAGWYSIPPRSVRAAIEYESRLAA